MSKTYRPMFFELGQNRMCPLCSGVLSPAKSSFQAFRCHDCGEVFITSGHSQSDGSICLKHVQVGER